MKFLKKCFAFLAAFTFVVTFIFNIIQSINDEIEEGKRSCGVYPTDLLTDNVIWQVLETPKGFVKLLNAYLDERWDSSVVKINANGPKISLSGIPIFCQFWCKDSKQPHTVLASDIQNLWIKSHWPLPNNSKIPYLIVCPFDLNIKSVKSVSLTTYACDTAENLLEIIDNQPNRNVKENFGVCVKQIHFESRNFAIRFIEWVHLLRILGVQKIHLSVRYVHPELYKIMKHLERQDLIEMKPFLEPTGVPDVKHEWEARTLELNMINDCFYRVKNLYNYVAIIDPDEIIMPIPENVNSWLGLLEEASYKTNVKDAYLSRSVLYVPDSVDRDQDIPDYHYILTHLMREKRFLNFKESYANHKSILSPKNVLSVFNHGCLECYPENCSNHTFPTEVSHLNHYRDERKVAADKFSLVDKAALKFKDELILAVKKTLRETDFVP